MTKLEERLNQLADARSGKLFPQDNPIAMQRRDFIAGARAVLELPELKALVECAEFYSKIENLGKTVWEDDHRRDGKCWLENFDRYEVQECYGPTSTGDYGIKASDASEQWRSFIGDESNSSEIPNSSAESGTL